MLRMAQLNAAALAQPAPSSIYRRGDQPPRWVVDLMRSLSFSEKFSYPLKRRAHININEQQAFHSLVVGLAKTDPSSRFVILQDSRVSVGASAKGRSSSTPLNFALRRSVPYIIGGDLYPGSLHGPGEHNPADDPSRFVAVRAPAYAPPRWLLALERGDQRPFDWIRVADQFVEPLGPWVAPWCPGRAPGGPRDGPPVLLHSLGAGEKPSERGGRVAPLHSARSVGVWDTRPVIISTEPRSPNVSRRRWHGRWFRSVTCPFV